MAARRRAPHFAENFSRNLDEIRLFLEPAGGTPYERLLGRLFEEIIPTLSRFPRSGRNFFKHRILSQEGAILSRKLKALVKTGNELREFVVGDYIVLYLLKPAEVVFLSIKHHRQLSFDLRRFWL